MPVICISSPQGGSGKTTLAANLASAYAYRGNKVLLIDLNVQNALRHYFNLTLVGPHGFVPYIDNTDDWGQFILKVDTNLYLLPYGDVTWKQHLDFQILIHEKPDVFRKNISDITAKSGVVVIIDMPTSPQLALHEIQSLIDLQVTTLLADGIAPLLLEKIADRTFPGTPQDNHNHHCYVINKIDPRYEMSHDIEVYLKERMGDLVLGEIHDDSSVPAALASQKTLRTYRPASSALFDIDSIEEKISTRLNILVGNNDASPTL